MVRRVLDILMIAMVITMIMVNFLTRIVLAQVAIPKNIRTNEEDNKRANQIINDDQYSHLLNRYKSVIYKIVVQDAHSEDIIYQEKNKQYFNNSEYLLKNEMKILDSLRLDAKKSKSGVLLSNVDNLMGISVDLRSVINPFSEPAARICTILYNEGLINPYQLLLFFRGNEEVLTSGWINLIIKINN